MTISPGGAPRPEIVGLAVWSMGCLQFPINMCLMKNIQICQQKWKNVRMHRHFLMKILQGDGKSDKDTSLVEIKVKDK